MEGLQRPGSGFSGNSKFLRNFSSPDLKLLEISAFQRCARLRRLALPEGLLRICRDCFAETGLERVLVPATVEIVEAGAFGRCPALSFVLFAPGSRLRDVDSSAFASASPSGRRVGTVVVCAHERRLRKLLEKSLGSGVVGVALVSESGDEVFGRNVTIPSGARDLREGNGALEEKAVNASGGQGQIRERESSPNP